MQVGAPLEQRASFGCAVGKQTRRGGVQVTGALSHTAWERGAGAVVCVWLCVKQ